MSYIARQTLALVAGLTILSGYAQNITILATRGDVQVEQGGGWAKAVTGMKLTEQQKIRLGPQSYVALVFPGNKTRELRQSGTYTLGELLAQRGPAADDNPYVSRYTGYVISQAVASSGGRASGKTLGAVTRSTMAPTPRVPAQSLFYADRIQLHWDRVPGSEGYIVEVLDEAAQVIHSQEASADQTSIEINLEQKLKPGPCYYWRVSTRRHASLRSTGLCLRVLPAERAAALKKEEENLRRSLDLNTAAGQAILGAFYEQNGLFGYAWNAYQQAVALEPGAEGYVALRDGLAQRALTIQTSVTE